MHRLFFRVAVSLILVLLWGAGAGATYKDDIGFTRLQAELGSNTPTGAGVQVTQVEAEVGGAYMPDTTNSEFSGKTFYNTYPFYTSTSDHATGVAQLFYGNSSSIASGITSIINYDANYWLGGTYLNTTGGIQPDSSSSRVGPAI